MKPKVLIGVVAIVGFTSLLMYNFGNSISTYTTFDEIESSDNAHVVGNWVKEKPYGFKREKQQFTFYMEDNSGNVREVIYPRPKPNNFEQAEKLVVIGTIRGDTFYADEMLMKCPSKYNNANPDEFTKAEHS